MADSLDVFSDALLAGCREQGLSQPADRTAFLRLFDGNLYTGLQACGLTADQRARLLASLGARLSAAMPSCRPFAGIQAAFARMAGHAPVIVVTSNLTRVVAAWVRQHGLTGIADVLGADQGAGKVPKIRSVLMRYPGAEGVYIGDTCGDMREGREAGALPVAVAWGWHDAERLATAHPARIVHSPCELADYLCR